MLKIQQCRTGRCIWCLEETEVVEAEFSDGLKGLLCKKHVWQALKVRSGGQSSPKETEANRDKRA